MKKLVIVFLCLLMGYVTNCFAQSKSTTIVVRAVAKDAKFIGSSMGGAYVTIKEVKSGEVLAEGHTEGSTGDTGKLVREARDRYSQISTGGCR